MTSATRAYLALGFLIWTILVYFIGNEVGTEQENDRRVAEVANLRKTYAEARAKSEAEARQRLEDALQLGDELSNRLLVSETALRKQDTENAREISRLTTGRKCLDAAVVRVLNAGNQSPVDQRVPEATGSAPAADGPAATDTDVAEWASNARTQYDICRGRLDALINFEEGRP